MQTRADVAELAHADHDARQVQQCSLSALQLNAARLRPGAAACWQRGVWTPQSYPGYAFQAMADADVRNLRSTQRLIQMRDDLVALADGPGRFYPLPDASLHQTVVNTFSGERLQRHVLNRGLADRFPLLLRDCLAAIVPPRHEDAVQMSLIGLSLFRSAVGALGVFSNPAHYARVLALREQVYGHPQLFELGLRRTRPFIGHVTLLYLEVEPDLEERQRLLEAIAGYNQDLLRQPLPWFMPGAVLCDYAHLSAFRPHPVGLALKL